ncbi:YgaP family membrane protein [Rubrolithibacter danxiaensis]|uniref:YgaP family membrane protein n=1 Tax=Rubrolithibacter danxiaensis TaxID=3390805 RepID=UPI003BF80F63
MKNISNNLGNLKHYLFQHNATANIEMSERIVSLGTGSFIALKGLATIFSSPLISLLEIAAGGALIYRGVTGNCPVKSKFDNKTLSTEEAAKGNIPVSSAAAAMGSSTEMASTYMGSSWGSGSPGLMSDNLGSDYNSLS